MDRAQAKGFFIATLILGAAALANCAAHGGGLRPVQFACFFAVAIAGAMLKVVLPGIMGTLSVNYIFVLIGVSELSSAECMLIACSAVFVQGFFKANHKPRLFQVAFNVAVVALAVTAARNVYHSSFLHGQEVGVPLLLAMTAVTYFVVNTFPVASIISLTESKSLVRIWKECYLWSFPFYLLGAVIAGGFHLISVKFGWDIAILTLPGAYTVYKTYQLYLGRLQDEKVHGVKVADLHLRTIQALALAIDAKDHTTHDHLRRVQTYAVAIAQELRVSELEVEAIRAAALLHDIGKLAVPEHIVSKPGMLTPEEFEKMKIHPLVGAEILEQAEFPYPVVPIVRSHHEKWDGSGYPDGLKGEEIPIGARILSAVDCLDALASDRQYRKGLPLDQAMAVVVSEAGKSFDPKVVEVLRARYEQLDSQARKQPKEVTGLSKKVKVQPGINPAAGFEETQPSIGSEQNKIGFLTSIAAARKEVQVLFELSNDLGNSLSMDEMLSMFQVKVIRMIPHHFMVVSTVCEDRLVPQYVWGAHRHLVSIPLGQSLSEWVVQHDTPIINGNPSMPGCLDDSKITHLKSALAIPLHNGDTVMGTITLYHTEPNAFSKDHLRVLLSLGPRLAAAVNNAQKLSQAQESATIDFLTGLPNSRSLFVQLDSELERCRRQDSRLTILVCDLDGFKQVNDQFGHLEGNRILQLVAAALRSCCREYDYVARLGGDEFVILLPNISGEDLQDKIDRLRSAVAALTGPAGQSMVSLSIGEASYPETVGDADGILAEADRRMYVDKRRVKPLPKPDIVRLATAIRSEDQTADNYVAVIQDLD